MSKSRSFGREKATGESGSAGAGDGELGEDSEVARECSLCSGEKSGEGSGRAREGSGESAGGAGKRRVGHSDAVKRGDVVKRARDGIVGVVKLSDVVLLHDGDSLREVRDGLLDGERVGVGL